ncbi:MAG: hypothetical protein OXU94_06040 [Gammaproteobacteria bacterium]|nr:hypothetical protein [Gammaproteobacteria bacterium]
MPKYTKEDFDNGLANMLKEAKARGEPRQRITANELRKHVTHGEPYMRMACYALKRLMSHQGSKALPYEVEFDTGKLPG